MEPSLKTNPEIRPPGKVDQLTQNEDHIFQFTKSYITYYSAILFQC